MARVEYLRHKKVNNAVDDGTSEVQPQHWNLDSHAQSGVLGFDNPAEVLISAGVLSPTNTPALIVVGAESGTADDLDTLTITDYQDNDIVQLKASTGDTITVKHNKGNILLRNLTDLILDEDNPLWLKFDGTNWVQINGPEKIQVTVSGAVSTVEVKDY